ncbi:MAG: cytochrome P450 [Caldimonas sp.]
MSARPDLHEHGASADPAPPRNAPLQRFRDLPGPRALPFVGNALQIRPGDLHLQFEDWSRRYGDCFRLRLGRRNLLVVTDYTLIGTALRDRPERFRRPLYSGRIMAEMGFEQGLFFANDEIWKRQRRMVMAGFDPGHVKAYFPALQKVALRLQRRWQEAARSGAAIDLQADLMRYTVDAIAGLAFGAEVNTLESDDDIIQRHLNRVFPALFRRTLAPVRYWRYFRLPADRALERSVAEVKVAIAGFIAQARARLQADPDLRLHPRNLLEAMIAAADQRDSGVDDRDVAGNVLVMLIAGEDTTANTLAWMIDLLQRHPEALQRARDEVRRVAPDPARYSAEQMAALDYVEACAHETMRLKPVAPILGVQAVRDTTLAGIEVPAETLVIGLMRHDAMQDRHFTDAASFRPERWLAHGAPAQAATSAKRISMPFGAGPRVCPGRYLALMEMKLALAMLLGNFEIESVGTASGRPARELLSFSMGPVGLRMKLRPRDAR